jgi:hypothetical protein
MGRFRHCQSHPHSLQPNLNIFKPFLAATRIASTAALNSAAAAAAAKASMPAAILHAARLKRLAALLVLKQWWRQRPARRLPVLLVGRLLMLPSQRLGLLLLLLLLLRRWALAAAIISQAFFLGCLLAFMGERAARRGELRDISGFAKRLQCSELIACKLPRQELHTREDATKTAHCSICA